jgi:hypothetical protein
MKFKNFEGVEYTVNYNKPPTRFHASGLCDSPDTDDPQILIDPLKRKLESLPPI